VHTVRWLPTTARTYDMAQCVVLSALRCLFSHDNANRFQARIIKFGAHTKSWRKPVADMVSGRKCRRLRRRRRRRRAGVSVWASRRRLSGPVGRRFGPATPDIDMDSINPARFVSVISGGGGGCSWGVAFTARSATPRRWPPPWDRRATTVNRGRY